MSVHITAIFTAVLALLQIYCTLQVAGRRRAQRISLGDQGDKELQRRIRAHGNFTETVPMALLILLINEIQGLPETWLYALGIALVVGRISHFIALTRKVSLQFRVFGMSITLLVMLIGAILLVI
ncbi:MAG: glutathione metabolism protein [Proteobacteria bacterium]|jgi:uncharacterized protein|nr:glutathione metabolism protein [Pseudomonadota bacterium]